MGKRIGQVSAFLLLMSGLGVLASDYIVFGYRQRSGNALDVVTVREYLSTPLKNGRAELDYLGDTDHPCVRTMLPHQGMPPCWWVRRHQDHWTRS
jgi:hypothetical protein